MKKLYRKAVYVFRRDLRLEDNTALLAALETSEAVLPVFIFDPRQVDRSRNPYFSEPAFQFLLTSLQELHEELQTRGSRLYVFHGDPAEIITSLCTQDNIDAVFLNKDYTPFARKRDDEVREACEKHKGFLTRQV